MYALVRSVVALILVCISHNEAIEIPLNGKTLKSASKVEVRSKEGLRQVFLTRSDDKVAKIFCRQLKETIIISCHGNETNLSDCKELETNGTAFLCSISLNLTGLCIFIIIIGLLLLVFIAMIIITCRRHLKTRRHKKHSITDHRKISVLKVIANTTADSSNESQHEPHVSTSPIPLLSFSSEAEERTNTEPDKHFVSVSVQTETTIHTDDNVTIDGIRRNSDVFRYRSSKGRRYMPLKRGSKYFMHFYTKLNKDRNPNACTRSDSTTSLEYQNIGEEHIGIQGEHKDKRRMSSTEDYQTIGCYDESEDFEYLHIKVEDISKQILATDEDQPVYLVLLPDDEDHYQEYLKPAVEPVSEEEITDTYDPKLPPTPIEVGLREQNDPYNPPEASSSEHDGTVSRSFINNLPKPQFLLRSVDERLKPNDHDVYDALELEYNVPNQFRKYKNTDKKHDPQSFNTFADLTDSETNSREKPKDKKPLKGEQNDTDGQSSDEEDHNYENIGVQKDENDNALVYRSQSCTYESLSDLKNLGYESR